MYEIKELAGSYELGPATLPRLPCRLVADVARVFFLQRHRTQLQWRCGFHLDRHRRLYWREEENVTDVSGVSKSVSSTGESARTRRGTSSMKRDQGSPSKTSLFQHAKQSNKRPNMRRETFTKLTNDFDRVCLESILDLLLANVDNGRVRCARRHGSGERSLR